MPQVTPLTQRDFQIATGGRQKVLRLARDGPAIVIFYDRSKQDQQRLVSAISGSRAAAGADVYCLDVVSSRAVPANSRDTTTPITTAPKIIGYIDGQPEGIFDARTPKTLANVVEFARVIASKIQEEVVEEEAPPPRRGGGGGGGRRPARRPAPAPAFEEDPDDGMEFIVPPGVKPHNTPWIEVEEDY